METSSRRVVWALGTALGLALLTIAFLLGRVSAKPATLAVATAPSEAAQSTTTDAAPPSPVASGAEFAFPGSEPARDPSIRPLDSSRPVVTSITATPASPKVSPETPTRGVQGGAPVTAYFAEVERLEDLGAGDPKAFANSMMPALSSGDFSGFDELLAKARSQRQRLQAVAPPSSCAEYHRLALALSADSVTMLERLKAALMKGDSMALIGIASDGRTLEAQAAQLKSTGEKIKRQAGG